MTVGTPFIHLGKARFLFSRLGVSGKATYLIVLALAFAAVWSFTRRQRGPEFDDISLSGWQIVMRIVTVVGPFAVFFVIAWLINH